MNRVRRLPARALRARLALGCAVGLLGLTPAVGAAPTEGVPAQVQRAHVVPSGKGVAIEVEGTKPTPCHRLRVLRLPAKRARVLRLRIVAVPPAGGVVCAQVLTPFSLRIAPPAGTREVWLNGKRLRLSR